MMLLVALALTLPAAPIPVAGSTRAINSEQQHFGLSSAPVHSARTWLIPPKLPKCLPNGYCFTAKDLRETDESRRAEKEEWERIQGLARKGDVRQMSRAGYMLLNGIIAPQDEAAAMGWFYEAAVRGDVTSMYALGCGFQDGVGVDKDPKLAAYWQTKAAEHGAPKTCDPAPRQPVPR